MEKLKQKFSKLKEKIKTLFKKDKNIKKDTSFGYCIKKFICILTVVGILLLGERVIRGFVFEEALKWFFNLSVAQQVVALILDTTLILFVVGILIYTLNYVFFTKYINKTVKYGINKFKFKKFAIISSIVILIVTLLSGIILPNVTRYLNHRDAAIIEQYSDDDKDQKEEQEEKSEEKQEEAEPEQKQEIEPEQKPAEETKYQAKNEAKTNNNGNNNNSTIVPNNSNSKEDTKQPEISDEQVDNGPTTDFSEADTDKIKHDKEENVEQENKDDEIIELEPEEDKEDSENPNNNGGEIINPEENDNVEVLPEIDMNDLEQPEVSLVGDQTVKVGDIFTISVTATDNKEVTEFNFDKTSIEGLDSKLQIQSINVSGNNADITLKAMEQGNTHLSIVSKVAKDAAGNTSSKSNEINIIINAYEEPEIIEPDVQEPEEPGIEQPEQPEIIEPEQPETQEPGTDKPEFVEPEEPEVIEPEKPEIIEPEEPEVIEPEQPETQEPGTDEPEFVEPEEPEVIEPDEPEFVEPEEPEVIEPEQPEIQEPGTDEPEITDPVIPEEDDNVSDDDIIFDE